MAHGNALQHMSMQQRGLGGDKSNWQSKTFSFLAKIMMDVGEREIIFVHF